MGLNRARHVEGARNGVFQYSRIFILSTPRSGSTLLRYILDTHPDICCPGEISIGALCAHLSTAVHYTTAQLRASNETHRARLTAAEVRSVVDSLMNSYAELKKKSIW